MGDSPGRAAAHACAPRPGLGAPACRKHGRQLWRPSRQCRPRHSASGAAGPAAALGLALGHPRRVRHACRRPAPVRSAHACHGFAARSGDCSPCRRPPRRRIPRTRPQGQTPPRSGPLYGSRCPHGRRGQVRHRSVPLTSLQAPRAHDSPCRLPPAHPPGLPMAGSPQAVTQSMTLRLSPKRKYARAFPRNASLRDSPRATRGCGARR